MVSFTNESSLSTEFFAFLHEDTLYNITLRYEASIVKHGTVLWKKAGNEALLITKLFSYN